MFGRRKDNLTPPPAGQTSGQFSAENPRAAPRSPSEAIKPQMAPPPPPRLRRSRGGLLATLSGIFTLAVVAAFIVLLGAVMIEREASAPGPLASDKVIVIPRNTGVDEIARILEREGVIDQPFVFEIQAFLNRHRGALKAGEFLFKANASIDDTIDTLTQGRSVLHTFTAPEGLTSQQIVERLRENEILTGEVSQVPPEGTLLPDTYKFERGWTRQQVLATMQESHRKMVEQIWERRAPDLPLKSAKELVILASIVEKETGRADERTRVAGVFINRLRRNMRLQSDPTIVYGLVGGQGTLGRGILRSEIEKPTPYNTYVIDGLPPGPIANPGRAALEAVANPSRTRDLYFVADGTGGHAFAESYEQHLRNVARWRQIERDRGAGQGTGEVDRAAPTEIRGDLAPEAPAGPELPTREALLADPAIGTQIKLPPARLDARATLAVVVPPEETEEAALASPVAFTASTRRNPADASEGTPLDPLRNRTYDLNSPKSVPALDP